MLNLTEEQINDVMNEDLLKLKSGDANNGIFLAKYNSEDEKRKMIEIFNKSLAGSSVIGFIENTIFSRNITDSNFVRCTLYLTFANIISKLVHEDWSAEPNRLYFTLLVNYNGGGINGKGVSAIDSVARLSDIVSAMKAKGKNLDYKDFLSDPDLDSEGKWSGDYKQIKVPLSQYNTGIHINLPIIKKKLLPAYRFASGERRAGILVLDIDDQNVDYIIPYNIWQNMIVAGMNNKKSAWFVNGVDNFQLAKIVKEDVKQLDQIFTVNGLKKVASFLNTFKFEITDEGMLMVKGVTEADIEDLLDPGTSAVRWELVCGDGNIKTYKLKSPLDYYIIKVTSSSYDIIIPT